MKKILLTLLLLNSSLLALKAQSWLWARQGKNHFTDNSGTGIAMDSYHNAYSTGFFSNDTMIFNSDTLLAPNGKLDEAYLTKYDKNGNLLWARCSQTSKNGFAASAAIAIDRQNNVYITGDFFDTAYFQSFAVETPSNNNLNVFLTKYDENGNVLWAKQSTDNRSQATSMGLGVVTDKSGNIYITGYFFDTVTFGSQTLRTLYSGTFLVKYDSNGNVLWARQSNSSNYLNGSNAIAIDKSGFIYISGYFTDTAIFGPQILTSASEDAYIVKYDSSGNVIWARQSRTINQNDCGGHGVCTDKEENVYVNGAFIDTVSFGATTLIGIKQGYTIFWAKYDSAGNILWAKQSYNLDSLQYLPWSINTDGYENLYLTGWGGTGVSYNKMKVIFDADTLQLTKAEIALFLIKMDSSGSVSNGYIFNCGGNNQPLAVDSSGCYVYYGGSVDTSVVFGNDTIGVGAKPNYEDWPFIARWSDEECASGINTIAGLTITVNLYPNPNNGKFTLAISHAELVSASQTRIEIYNVLGEKVYAETLKQVQGDNLIDLGNKSSGVYLYRIIDQQSNLISSGKFIIQ